MNRIIILGERKSRFNGTGSSAFICHLLTQQNPQGKSKNRAKNPNSPKRRASIHAVPDTGRYRGHLSQKDIFFFLFAQLSQCNTVFFCVCMWEKHRIPCAKITQVRDTHHWTERKKMVGMIICSRTPNCVCGLLISSSMC